jgi:hypothetical protein
LVLSVKSFSTQFNLRYEHRLQGHSDKAREDVARLSVSASQNLDSQTTLTLSHIVHAATNGTRQYNASHLTHFTRLDLHRQWESQGIGIDLGIQYQGGPQNKAAGGALAWRAGLDFDVGRHSSLGFSYQTKPFASTALGTQSYGSHGLNLDLSISRRF